ncbi:MAG: PhoU domain-containing protein, partial [Ilumatobacteraceae bacterium]
MAMDEARKSFHKDLTEVHQELVRIAASIVESIPRGTHVLVEQDLAEAERMILADDDVDTRTVDIESRCIQILALQAPVAGELRQVVSALKICGELE